MEEIWGTYRLIRAGNEAFTLSTNSRRSLTLVLILKTVSLDNLLTNYILYINYIKRKESQVKLNKRITPLITAVDTLPMKTPAPAPDSNIPQIRNLDFLNLE